MSQEWQRGERRREAEGDRRGEWSGGFAEEGGRGRVCNYARDGKRRRAKFNIGDGSARGGNFFAFRLDSIGRR